MLFSESLLDDCLLGMRMSNLPRCTKLWQLFHIARLEMKMEIYLNCLTLPTSLKAML